MVHLDEMEKLAGRSPLRGLIDKLRAPAARARSAAQDHRRGLVLAGAAGLAGIALAGKTPLPDKRNLMRPINEGRDLLEKEARVRRRPYGMNPVVNLLPRIRLKHGKASEKLHLLSAYLSRPL